MPQKFRCTILHSIELCHRLAYYTTLYSTVININNILIAVILALIDIKLTHIYSLHVKVTEFLSGGLNQFWTMAFFVFCAFVEKSLLYLLQ